MEKHLSKIAASVQLYITRMAVVKQTNKEILALARAANKKHGVFLNALNLVKAPLVAYRNALSPTLVKADIDIRIETWEHTSIILSKTNRPQDLILFAIASKKAAQLARWRHCGFLAIWGDYAKGQVHVYEYADEIDRENPKNNRIQRNEFPKYSRHLHTFAIAHFDFDKVKPMITAYLSKELNYLMKKYNPGQIMEFINSIS
ncbi:MULTISPECIES: hypothetical protein [Sphingobacterium]|uniref:hypothetical protein n=1 Tax=Sphingobacterium TaxID=28453 RepID=UPI0013DD741F|nr:MULTISPECIES: hypothetical protein [unclassified Sphingobacterium]